MPKLTPLGMLVLLVVMVTDPVPVPLPMVLPVTVPILNVPDAAQIPHHRPGAVFQVAVVDKEKFATVFP